MKKEMYFDFTLNIDNEYFANHGIFKIEENIIEGYVAGYDLVIGIYDEENQTLEIELYEFNVEELTFFVSSFKLHIYNLYLPGTFHLTNADFEDSYAILDVVKKIDDFDKIQFAEKLFFLKTIYSIST